VRGDAAGATARTTHRSVDHRPIARVNEFSRAADRDLPHATPDRVIRVAGERTAFAGGNGR
jgi:hypothetical protein